MLTRFFKDSDFIVVLQTRFGSGFLTLGSGLESDSKKLESEHLWQIYRAWWIFCGDFNVTREPTYDRCGSTRAKAFSCIINMWIPHKWTIFWEQKLYGGQKTILLI